MTTNAPGNHGRPQRRRYPVPLTDSETRFTLGLQVEVAEVLQQHGYPAIKSENGLDLVELGNALFGFLYGNQAGDAR